MDTEQRIIKLETDMQQHHHDGMLGRQVYEKDVFSRKKYVLFKVIGPTTDQTVATSFGGDLEIPFSGNVTEIGAFVDTVGTTGTVTIDVNKNGITLMAVTKITIDSTEKSSRTAAISPVLTSSTASLREGDIITVDIDAIQTTPAKGLTVRLTIEL